MFTRKTSCEFKKKLKFFPTDESHSKEAHKDTWWGILGKYSLNFYHNSWLLQISNCRNACIQFFHVMWLCLYFKNTTLFFWRFCNIMLGKWVFLLNIFSFQLSKSLDIKKNTFLKYLVSLFRSCFLYYFFLVDTIS